MQALSAVRPAACSGLRNDVTCRRKRRREKLELEDEDYDLLEENQVTVRTHAQQQCHSAAGGQGKLEFCRTGGGQSQQRHMQGAGSGQWHHAAMLHAAGHPAAAQGGAQAHPQAV
jgi:hypothetical protein